MAFSETEKNKIDETLREMVSHKSDFGNDTLAYQKFLKEKYGVWVAIFWEESGEMLFSFNTKTLAQIARG